jgi:DNA-binding NarL/FixJ family response regulator
MPRLRVLICDDAVMLATMLSSWFADDPEIEIVGTADSALEGLAEAERLAPEVILLDHLLPDGHSGDVVPQLRARAPGAAVVLMSGLDGELLADAATGAGAQAWVSKASTQEDVRAAILEAARAR